MSQPELIESTVSSIDCKSAKICTASQAEIAEFCSTRPFSARLNKLLENRENLLNLAFFVNKTVYQGLFTEFGAEKLGFIPCALDFRNIPIFDYGVFGDIALVEVVADEH